MKALFLILLLCYSCEKNAVLTTDSVGLEVRQVQMDITSLNGIEWKIGKFREAQVTQSFTFILGLPKLTADDLEHITKAKSADSWIIRIFQVKPSGAQDLGSLYVPFRPQNKGRGVSQSSPAHVSLKVYYAAAYASERFRSMQCPMFGHDKVIDKMSVEGPHEEFSFLIGQAIPYGEKPQVVQLTPSSFNGGNELKGQYYLEIAAYDSKNKNIFGGFKRVPRYVEITSEAVAKMETCLGVRPE